MNHPAALGRDRYLGRPRKGPHGMKVSVLGAGLVGSAIAKDLAADGRFQVTAVDRSAEALAPLAGLPGLATRTANLSDPAAVRAVVEDAGIVALAVPGHIGFATLRAVIDAGCDVVDISFFPEDPFELDALARERDVTAVVDAGVAPGLCNIIAGHVDEEWDRLDRYLCYVGGLPREPEWPYGYRSVFSPIDVLEEYTRPARYVEGGELVVVPALSDVERIDFEGVGTLEAFNTDGLRTLARTLDAPDMKEKTLRWPGHAELMRIFRETGFFGKEPIQAGWVGVAPIDVVSTLLFEAWRMRPGDEDVTVLRVELEGESNGRSLRQTWDLVDTYDRETGTTSMARTTGYTCSLVVRMVADGLYRHAGISPPEYLGRSEACWEALLAGYRERGITPVVRSESP
jgi:saccharopine dehydrogenase-like NADP-dependent oxidoreductase